MDEDELHRRAVDAVARFDNREVKRLLGFDPCTETFERMSELACELGNLKAIALLAVYAEERAWTDQLAVRETYGTAVNDLLAMLYPAMVEAELFHSACVSDDAKWATLLCRRYRADARRAASNAERGCLVHDRLSVMITLQRALERWDRIRAAVRRRRPLRRLFFAWLEVHVKERYGADGVGRRRDREAFEADVFPVV
jgi:hypothetical protein